MLQLHKYGDRLVSKERKKPFSKVNSLSKYQLYSQTNRCYFLLSDV